MANNSTKAKIIIDTDCGVDDAQAIILALSRQYEESLEVLAITCVSGNVGLDKVCINVLKVLEVCSRTDIPVYKGSYNALLAHNLDATDAHGTDGLGDVSDIPQPDMDLLNKEQAVNFLVQTVSENPGEITVIALGPLTNLALACKMDPAFSTNLKKVFIMGGNTEAKGNITVCGEFNFHFDPESAHIVLSEVCCPLELVTLEICRKVVLDPDFLAHYLSQKTKKGKFVKLITMPGVASHRHKCGYYVPHDSLAVAVFLEPDLVLKSEKVFATVEMQGKYTRGQTVIDWRGILGKKNNVTLPIETDLERFKSLLIKSLQ